MSLIDNYDGHISMIFSFQRGKDGRRYTAKNNRVVCEELRIGAFSDTVSEYSTVFTFDEENLNPILFEIAALDDFFYRREHGF